MRDGFKSAIRTVLYCAKILNNEIIPLCCLIKITHTELISFTSSNGGIVQVSNYVDIIFFEEHQLVFALYNKRCSSLNQRKSMSVVK